MKLEVFGFGLHLKFYRSGYKGKLQVKNDKIVRLKHINFQLRKRAANGVCPCCTRTFEVMANHIKDSHPRYLAKTLEAKSETE